MKAKRNLFVSLVTLMLLLCCSMLFVACLAGGNKPNNDQNDDPNGSGEHIHAYAETRIEPTCTNPGSILYECACGESYSEPVPALGHDWVEHAEVVATCSKSGYTAYKQCSVCKEYENGYAGEIISELGHDWVEHTGVVATCTERGYTSYKQCSVCEEYENDYAGEVISVLGHDISGAGCTRCKIELATGLAYTLSEDNTYYIVSGIGSETRTAFIVPSTYNGLPVKEIGEKAFMGCREITEIGLPSGITKIGDNAFWNCESLVKINIPNGVTSIGALAFMWTELEELILPSSIERIGDAAFASMLSLKNIAIDGENEYYRVAGNCLIDIKTKTLLRGTGSSVIPADGSVISIGKNAFSYCYGLESIVIPEGVTSIGDDAFVQCSALKSVTLPDSLTTIGEQAFSNCKFTEVVLGEGVTSVGVRAFWACYNLKTVTIPVSLAYIDYQTFQNCYALEKIIFTGTGEQWFAVEKASNWDDGSGNYVVECRKDSQNDILTFTLSKDGTYYIVSGVGGEPAASFVIPSTYNGLPVREIAEKAFYECTTVEEIVLPSSVTSIGAYAFSGCASLTDIRISGGVSRIGEYAFSGCTALTEITLPSSITDIEAYAFSGCGALSSVTIPNGVKQIGEYAFSGCTALVYLTIPSGVTKIEAYAFSGCTALTVVTLSPDLDNDMKTCVASIGEYAFSGCTLLESLYIANGVTDIGAYVFSGCASLASVEIPDSVATIGAHAFSDCTALTSVSLGIGLETIGESAFTGSALDSVYVKDLAAWCGISGISAFGYDDERAFTLYLNNAPLSGELVIPDGVKSIGSHAFWNVRSITSIKLPNSLLKIGSHAFKGCSGVTSIVLPSSLTTIEGSAFIDCSSLPDIEIPSGVTSIGTYTFYNCTSLASITLPNGITSIGSHAFYGCTALASISIPKGVTEIESYTFYNCTNLSSVSLPSTIENIRSYAFRGCTSLKRITLPSNLKIIYTYAFYKSGLEIISLKSSLKRVGTYAFARCTSLTKVNFPANSVVEIQGYAFKGCTALTDVTIRKAKLGIGVFKECTGLKNVTVLSSVSRMEKSVFIGCTSLESLTLPYVGYSSSAVASKYCYLGYLFGAEKYRESADYIPSSLKSITLTGDSAGLSENTFYGCTGITSVTVADGVTTLPRGVFKHLISLESISLAFVGGSASATEASSQTLFGYIFGYSTVDRTATTAVTQYYGYTYNTSGLVVFKEETYYIPNSLKSVTLNGSTFFGAFSNCTGLTSITFGENVKTIAEHTFLGCSGIKEVHMTDIGAWCGIDFYYKDVRRDNPIFKSKVSFYYDGAIVTDLVIPEGVTSINGYVFWNRTSINSVTLPSSLETVGTGAFYGCSGITKVNTSNISDWCGIDFASSSASPLNYGASLYCNGSLVTELTIPDEVTKIGSYTFYNYALLKSVTMNDNLKTVGISAFYNTGITNVYTTDLEKWCAIDFGSAGANPLSSGASLYCNGSPVTELVLADGATKIGNYVFYGCTALKSVTLPDGVKTIGTEAFGNCTNLTSLSIGTGLESMDGSFVGASVVDVYIKDLKAWCGISGLATLRLYGNDITLYLNNTPVSGTLTIPDGATSISDYAFYNDTGITSVKLPTSVTSIGSYAFARCTSIEGVNIPAAVTSIGSYAFSGCSALANISIPDGVSIGEYSFIECDALTKVSSPYSLIYNFYAAVELTVTSGDYDEYESSQRGTLKNLTTLIIGDRVTSVGGFERQFPSVKTLYIGSGVTNIDHGIASNRSMTISVSEKNTSYKTVDGVLYTKDGKKLLYYPATKTATSFAVPSGVEDVGYYAFAYSNNLKSVTLPDTVKTIGDYAFHKCVGLTSIDFGQGVTTIGVEAFYYCTGFTSVTIPSSVTNIKSYAFYGCTNMQSMIMEASESRENPYAWYMTGDSEELGEVFIDMGDAEAACNNFAKSGAAKANYYRK